MSETQLIKLNEAIAEIRRDVQELKRSQYVKIINGETKQRVANEVLAEMHLDIKELKKNRPSNMLRKAGEWLPVLVSMGTFGMLIYITFFKG